MREVAYALYLKRNLVVLLPTGETQTIMRSSTKQDVYHQLQCIYHELAPSRSTVARWLKQLEDAQPALVAYARGTQVAIRTNHMSKINQASSATLRTPSEEAPPKSLREHREDQARFIAEIRADYDRLIHMLDSLDGQVVLDAATGQFIFQQVDKEEMMNDNDEQGLNAMLPRRTRPQMLYVDNGQAFSEASATSDAKQTNQARTEVSHPRGHGKVERIFQIDHRRLDGLSGHIESSDT
jgi:hypothetical protein